MNKSKPAVVVMRMLELYKRFLSPLLPPACRFTPSCSEYMYEAVSHYGAAKGIFMGMKRILRCNPFCKGGFDPVR
jgi:uncharacterized protein